MKFKFKDGTIIEPIENDNKSKDELIAEAKQIYKEFKDSKIEDKEVLSIKQMFNDDKCAGWIFYSGDENKCWGAESNNLGLPEFLPLDDEEDFSDKMVLEKKIDLPNGKYICVGNFTDGLTIDDIPNEEVKSMDEIIKEIKKAWAIKEDNQVRDNKSLNQIIKEVSTFQKDKKFDVIDFKKKLEENGFEVEYIENLSKTWQEHDGEYFKDYDIKLKDRTHIFFKLIADKEFNTIEAIAYKNGIRDSKLKDKQDVNIAKNYEKTLGLEIDDKYIVEGSEFTFRVEYYIDKIIPNDFITQEEYDELDEIPVIYAEYDFDANIGENYIIDEGHKYTMGWYMDIDNITISSIELDLKYVENEKVKQYAEMIKDKVSKDIELAKVEVNERVNIDFLKELIREYNETREADAAEAAYESARERYIDSLTNYKDYTLHYDDLHVEYTGKLLYPETRYEPAEYDIIEDDVEYDYELYEGDIIDGLVNVMMDIESYKDMSLDDLEELIKKDVDKYYNEYYDKLLEYFRENASEKASEYYSDTYSYNKYDYED